MTDRTTINVTKDAHQTAKEAKKDGESWSEYIQRCIGEGQEPNPQPMQFDWGKFDRKLQDHLAEWEITVNLDQLDLEPVGMDESDVENVIERYLEKNWQDIQQGNI